MSSHSYRCPSARPERLVGIILTISLVLTTRSIGESLNSLLESRLAAGAERLGLWLDVCWGLLEHGLLEEDGGIGGLGHVLLDET